VVIFNKTQRKTYIILCIVLHLQRDHCNSLSNNGYEFAPIYLLKFKATYVSSFQNTHLKNVFIPFQRNLHLLFRRNNENARRLPCGKKYTDNIKTYVNLHYRHIRNKSSTSRLTQLVRSPYHRPKHDICSPSYLDGLHKHVVRITASSMCCREVTEKRPNDGGDNNCRCFPFPAYGSTTGLHHSP
jgi:hypothetical protein